MGYADESQLECSAFDAGFSFKAPEESLNKEGERYRGSRLVEGVESTAKNLYENSASVRLATQGISKVAQGLNWISEPLIQASEQNETAPIYPGAMIEGRSGNAMLGDAVRFGKWAGGGLINQSGKGAKLLGSKINLDPRISQFIGEGAMEELLTLGAGKVLKNASKLKINNTSNLIPALATVDNVPVSTLNKVDNFTPSNVFASSSDPLYDTSKVKVNRVSGGYGKGHLGLANIMYEGNTGLKQKFNKLRTLQQEGPLKHHHIEDVAFTGQWANTSDFEEVFQELNKLKIYPGDSPTNIIGMMDEGNMFLQTGKTDLIRELKRTNFPGLEGVDRYSDLMRTDAPKGIKRIIDDIFKSPEYGDEFFPGSIDKLGNKTPNQMQNMFETLPDGKRVPTVLPKKDISGDTWKVLGLDTVSKDFQKLPIEQQKLLKSQAWSKRFQTLGVNRKNIKYDPTKMILSKDHIDTIHYSVYNSPKFTQKRELLKMIEDGSYYKLNPQQKAEKIAEVYRVQKDTSINVAKRRLRLIKKYLKNAEPKRYESMYSKDPNKLREWIIDNPSISANLGWKDGIPDYKTLINPKTAEKITDEFRTVFSTGVREIPNPINIDEAFSQMRRKGF